MRLLSLFSFCILSLGAVASHAEVRAIRVDPGILYDDYPGISNVSTVASRVVADAVQAGANTLFVYAYNAYYGAYYPTTYSMTSVEGDYGKKNMFNALVQAGHASGLRVIGSLPVNDFRAVWNAQPAWRSKQKSGADYKPSGELNLLSVWHNSFRNWYQGFVQDFLSRNPGVDGIETVEPQIDFYWNKTADYNSQAKNKYLAAYPNGKLGDANWLLHRAAGLTSLQGNVFRLARSLGKKTFVVQTWSVGPTGNLFSSADIRNGCGFDFDGLMNLPGTDRPDYVVGEFMWQQWASEYGAGIFTPEWTSFATQSFLQKVAGRAIGIPHVELSGFWGSSAYVEPTVSEFQRSLQAATSAGNGADFYDYHLMKSRNAIGASRVGYSNSTPAW